jgi:predicted TIM-barrel fold metal-dependent hydrolase
MMLIDIHVHCSKQRHLQVSRPDGSQYPTPERLIEMMDEAGIDIAVVMSTVSPEWRYTPVIPEETLEVCARYPERLVPFCSLDPRYLAYSADVDFRPLLGAYVELGCVGVGEYLPNLPLDDPLNLNLFAQVQEMGLPLTFHLAPRIGGYYGCVDELGLPRLERVLRAFPNLVFLAHSQVFWSEISADVTEATRGGYPKGPVKPGRVVELMCRYPNLHGDLSANSGYNALTRDPAFGLSFLKEFQDRLYFATDIAHMVQDLPIVRFFHKLRAEALLSEQALAKIAWQNADRTLGLGLGSRTGSPAL